MHLTLVIPGPLDWSASLLAAADADATALPRVLAAAGAPAPEEDGLLACACRACGIARQSDWPLAPWLVRAAGLDPESAYWLCADPAALVVGQDDVRLSALVDDLTAADAESLRAALNAHFAADGVTFLAPTPAHWFARIGEAQSLVTRPPEAAQGSPLFAFLPAGADAARWKRWQSEAQMLLFEHEVNRRREAQRLAPVNSVWLWGGGTHQPPDASAARLFASEGRLTQLARGAALEVSPVPASFDSLRPEAKAAVWLAPDRCALPRS
jgi:hypothetical protein